MNAIVLADRNWGIAKDGKQITFIKKDLKRFRDFTSGGIIVYGRKTLESFPNQNPLPGRVNLCLSSTLERSNGLEVVRSIDDILEFNSSSMWCVGGESVYKQLYPYFDAIFVTRLWSDLKADQHFIDIDKDPAFELHRGWLTFDETTNLMYSFDIYNRRK